MLRREVEILKTVKHPNIVEIVAVYDEPNYLHIVSELCTGGELFERIIKKSASAEKHFSEADAARMLAEILGAVAYCHGSAGPDSRSSVGVCRSRVIADLNSAQVLRR